MLNMHIILIKLSFCDHENDREREAFDWIYLTSCKNNKARN